MDLITPDQAEALIEKGATLRERAMASVELDEPKVGEQTTQDRLGVHALFFVQSPCVGGTRVDRTAGLGVAVTNPR
jgi:hypothetical protein